MNTPTRIFPLNIGQKLLKLQQTWTQKAQGAETPDQDHDTVNLSLRRIREWAGVPALNDLEHGDYRIFTADKIVAALQDIERHTPNPNVHDFFELRIAMNKFAQTVKDAPSESDGSLPAKIPVELALIHKIRKHRTAIQTAGVNAKTENNIDAADRLLTLDDRLTFLLKHCIICSEAIPAHVGDWEKEHLAEPEEPSRFFLNPPTFLG